MRRLCFLVLMMLIVPGVLADSVDYQIFDNKALVEIELNEVSDFSYKLPYDVSVLEVSVSYDVLNGVLFIDEGVNVSISYISGDYVDEAEIRNFFIVKNKFENAIDVRLFLDEGAILSGRDNRLIVPEPSSLETDGRRVILNWNDFEGSEIIVDYEPVRDENYSLALFLFVLALVILFYSLWRNGNKKRAVKVGKKLSRKSVLKKRKKEKTTNLYGDEKKIVEYLFERKGRESWTKDIVRDLSISKVKLSRKLRSLEQKGLIVKVPYGNENRIRLKK